MRALLLIALSACAAHVDPPLTSPAAGYPLSVWTAESFAQACSTPWMRPSLLCVPNIEPRWDGCHWLCPTTEYRDEQ